MCSHLPCQIKDIQIPTLLDWFVFFIGLRIHIIFFQEQDMSHFLLESLAGFSKLNEWLIPLSCKRSAVYGPAYKI